MKTYTADEVDEMIGRLRAIALACSDPDTPSAASAFYAGSDGSRHKMPTKIPTF